MLTSSQVKPNPRGGEDNQMMEPPVTQHILIFNIRPSQQLKGGGLGGAGVLSPLPF